MTATNHPDEYGFAGDATAGGPADIDEAPVRDTAGERAAVPAGDLPASIGDGIDELTHSGNAREDDPR